MPAPRRTFTLLALVFTMTMAAIATAVPVQAFSNAFFHTQRQGDRGVDTLAVQYLLNAAGHTVATDGVFGSGTATAVKSFQSSQGLDSDGIVGPLTWGELTPTLRDGDSGPAVAALQVQLNAKRRLSLTVDGDFGPATRSAVVSFQRHAGIGVDGIVGPVTWKNLIWHFDYPAFSASGLCNKNPDGNSNADWGTASSIGQLEAATRSFASSGNGRVPVGDIGWEHGGDIPGHGSHEVGLDVDLWPIRTDSAQCTAGRITWKSGTYDRSATRQLVKALRATGTVRLIFFNDPTLIDEGLTSSWPNHDNHLHVRYCELGHPNTNYRCLTTDRP